MLFVFLLGGFCIFNLQFFGRSEQVFTILFIISLTIVMRGAIVRPWLRWIWLLGRGMLRRDISRVVVLSTTRPCRPPTSIPMEVLEVSAAATPMITSTTTGVEMVTSKCSLVSTEVLLV